MLIEKEIVINVTHTGENIVIIAQVKYIVKTMLMEVFSELAVTRARRLEGARELTHNIEARAWLSMHASLHYYPLPGRWKSS